MNVSDSMHARVLRCEKSFSVTPLIHSEWCPASGFLLMYFLNKFWGLGHRPESDFPEAVKFLLIGQNDKIQGLKESWKLYVLTYEVMNCSCRSLKMCASKVSRFWVWTLNESRELDMNHSKARDHVQLRCAFRHLKSWPVVIGWNLETDSEFSD